MAYDTLPDKQLVQATAANLEKKEYQVFTVADKQAAFEKIKELIPAKASVMNGSSTTLEQIGFVEYLKSDTHPWDNLHAAIVAEEDETKKAELRQQALHSQYYLGSVHALVETGDFLVASNTGSQLPHIVYTSENLVFVVGTQKIVPSLEEGMNRLEEHVMPLEDQNMQNKYNINTFLSKLLIFKGKSPGMQRNITFILVDEVLGF